MSGNAERKSEDEQGTTMIPVFTVIKNGAILKNIFVVNKSLGQILGSSSAEFVENSVNPDHQTEEILIVGRHPDCNIVLMHPSISRFHLQINSNPSLRKLFVIDLSSVHGTWISEKKIEPGFRVEMREGDTIRMGGSTRVYRLHWIPLSRAYDSENPFVSESDLALIRGKEEENIDSMSQENVEEKDTSVVQDKAEDRNQDIDIFGYKKEETQYLDSILEDVVSLFPDENLGLILSSTSAERNSFHGNKQEMENSSTNDNELSLRPVGGVILNEKIPSSISAGMNSFHGGKEEIEKVSSSDNELSLKSVGGAILQTLTAIFYDCNQGPEYLSADEDLDISKASRLELESHFEIGSDSPSSIIEEDSESQTTKETNSQSLLRKKESKVDSVPVQTLQLSMPAGEFSDNEFMNSEDKYPDAISALNPLSEKGCRGNEAVNKQLNLQNASRDDPKVTELFVGTENLSPLGNENLMRESTPDYTVAIEVIEGTENQSPLRKEGVLNETKLDDPVAIKVIGETKSKSLTMEEGILREPKIDDAAALEKTEKLSCNRNEGTTKEPTVEGTAVIEIIEETVNLSANWKDSILNEPTSDDPVVIQGLEEADNQCPSRKDGISNVQTIVSTSHHETQGSSKAPEFVSQSQQCQTPKSSLSENSENVLGSCDGCDVWARRSKSASALQLQTSRRQEKARGDKDWKNRETFYRKSIGKDRSSYIEAMAEEAYTPEKENCAPSISIMRSGKKNIGSQSTNGAIFPDIEATDEELYPPDKENHAPDTIEKKSARSSRHHLRLENGTLLKQRRAERLPLQSLLSNSPVRLSEASNPSAAKRSSSCNQKFTKSTSRVLFPDLEAMDQDVGKENCIPNFSLMSSENMITCTEKGSQTPVILQERKSARSSRHQFKLEKDSVLKERRAERVPLQSLISNSPVRLSEASLPGAAKRNSSCSSRTHKARNSNSVNSVGDKSRRWTMIADTTSLLNKETRGALELLQGLKGTHLIIPRIVMQELDSLKGCKSLFRRKSEASTALEWIEECMLKTKWWIHVQSSEEEARPASTSPRSTPVSQLGQGSKFFPFLAQGTLVEFVSPTAEDHILDCALFHKKSNSDRPIALLTNNVTLKVKAMAEGLVCETAREFRDSLVNPFSERFLWAESSPRGQTWSVLDDVVLKDKYYSSPSKESSRGETAKGLKLILLNKSQLVRSF